VWGRRGDGVTWRKGDLMTRRLGEEVKWREKA